MAVAPLFIADLAALKARLRLSGMGSADAAAQVDQAIEDVRLGFYDRLGKTRVDEILAVAYVENATTTAARVRPRGHLSGALICHCGIGTRSWANWCAPGPTWSRLPGFDCS